jgi:single-strand DNA-binding protein
MLNNVVLVGRLTQDPEIRVLESGKKVCDINLAITRPFKSLSGNYETDFIKCVLWDLLASTAQKNTKKGVMVTIKGRLQQRKIELSDGKHYSTVEVVAEVITFMASNQKQFDMELNSDIESE